ncbi:hypothetical protein [uncultured Tateyamaria sp.]|nr:hypothetical protein [uncultured Tateyamaria sp.]
MASTAEFQDGLKQIQSAVSVINYGGDNSNTLTGIPSSLISEEDFLFV